MGSAVKAAPLDGPRSVGTVTTDATRGSHLDEAPTGEKVSRENANHGTAPPRPRPEPPVDGHDLMKQMGAITEAGRDAADQGSTAPAWP